MQDHEQLALLLKSEAGFERIMELLLDKYRSYGEHRGKIDLHDASTIECEALNAFVSPKKFFKCLILNGQSVNHLIRTLL